MTETKGSERRRRDRVRVEGEVAGRIHTVNSAPIIDLSETGALLEVPVSLRPGSTYVLRLPFASGVVVKTRVVRSYVHGLVKLEDGESAVRYRSAVEFLNLADAERELIHEQIAIHHRREEREP